MDLPLTGLGQGAVDLPALVERIRAAFPYLAFASARLNDEGDDHAVVVLDRAWVFRFPRTKAAAAADLGERRLLSALGAAGGLTTPRYRHVWPSGDFGGYRLIAGEPLTERRFAALEPAAADRVLGQIGEFLGALHRLRVDLPLWTAADASEAYAARWAARRSTLAPALGEAASAAADRFYAALPAALQGAEATPIHGDFTSDHILLHPDGKRLAGVIDFADAAIGDPAYDYAWLWAYGPDAPVRAAAHESGVDIAAMLERSRWWFARYRLDQVWRTVSGARALDAPAIRRELLSLFAGLRP